MAVPRPVLLALLGIAASAALFLATRGASDPGGSVTPAPAPVAAAPAKHSAVAKHAAKPQHAAPAKVAPAPGKAPKPQPQRAARPAGVSAATLAKAAMVRKAMARGYAVVFFFTSPGAADDAATRAGVDSLDGMRRVVVVRAGLNELTAFRPVLAGAGVSQVPAVVVASAGHPARLLEGYVDGGTLRQTVADALR